MYKLIVVQISIEFEVFFVEKIDNNIPLLEL